MREICRSPRRRNAFTLVELLVVMALILVIFTLGIGYAVFGQDNQHSVSAAQAVTAAMLNAKNRGRRDGVPTGIRILFATNNGVTQASQLQLIQQPEDYNAGSCQSDPTPAPNNDPLKVIITLPTGVDLLGGAAYPGEIDEATVQAGDYFSVPGTGVVHRIAQVNSDGVSLELASTPGVMPAGSSYTIIRAPRRLPSEDVIQLPAGVVIDNSTVDGTTLCQNLPFRTLIDYPPNQSPQPRTQQYAEIVFAPSGAVVGQGTGADKVLLWLRDPTQPSPTAGVPLILSVQIRTGLIGVYPAAPWNTSQPVGPGNNPYLFVLDPRASGL